MLKILILRGLPASGKTTWALDIIRKNPGVYKRVNKDELRAMMDGSKWSGDNEKMVLHVRDLIVMNSLSSGKHVIVDDTNLHPKHKAKMEELAKLCPFDVEVEEKFFDIKVETAIKRDLERPRSVGEKVIRDMYEQFLASASEIYYHDPDKTEAIIVDIDGTLAHIE